jgi:Family of unknown function (DUF6113)
VSAGLARRASRIIALLMAFLLGAVVALAATAVHRVDSHLRGVVLPWGLVLGLVTSLVVGLAARYLLGQAGGVCLGAGWLSLFAWLTLGRPEGDFVIASDGLGWAMLILGLVTMAVLFAITLRRPSPPRGQR